MASEHDIRAAGLNPEDVKRHEIAHCNGWPSDHPRGRILLPTNDPWIYLLSVLDVFQRTVLENPSGPSDIHLIQPYLELK
jgi:hypothetical protein